MNLDSQSTRLSASSQEPRILSETSHWIVLDKPSGWLSIPGRSGRSDGGTQPPVVLRWVRERYSEALTVHRLDVETSGVMIFARGAEAHRQASLWFQNREVRKLYVCLASGRSPRPILKIQKPVEGAPCVTQVEVVAQFAAAFRAYARPMGGKRHQIRLHLAEAGHPLLGDSRYGGPRTIRSGQAGASSIGIERVALHAEALELPSGERFVAPLPADFLRWLAALEEETPR